MESLPTRLGTGLLMFAAAVGFAQAQENAPKRFAKLTANAFEEILNEAPIPFERQGNRFLVNLVPNVKSTLAVFEDQQAVVGFHSISNVSAEAVNDWNTSAIFSRASHLSAENPPRARLEADLDCNGGFDAKLVNLYLDRYRKAIGAFATLSAPAREHMIVEAPPNPGRAIADVQVAKINFPLGASDEEAKTGWIVNYRTDRNRGLRIVGAWFFRRGENPEWLKVADDLHVNHLYVPYMESSPRYFDMDPLIFPKHGPWRLDKAAKGEAHLTGPNGKVQPDQYTVREDRDAGLLWVMIPHRYQMERQIESERVGPTFGARRQELTLWGVYQASNYFYIMQYSFQNDGTIMCKLGSTGANLTGHGGPGHMHNALWRVHLDIGGSGPNQENGLGKHAISIVRHEENPIGNGAATTRVVPINNESKHNWRAEEFSFLRISNLAIVNRVGGAATYEVVPLRYGTARHYYPGARAGKGGVHPGDEFTQADFWITNLDQIRTDYRALPFYIRAADPLGPNPVIWLSSSNLHLPRDEDYSGPIGARQASSATVMFSGFELRPRSVLSETPYFDIPRGRDR